MVYLSSEIETPDAWYLEFDFFRDFEFLNDSIKVTLHRTDPNKSKRYNLYYLYKYNYTYVYEKNRVR